MPLLSGFLRLKSRESQSPKNCLQIVGMVIIIPIVKQPKTEFFEFLFFQAIFFPAFAQRKIFMREGNNWILMRERKPTLHLGIFSTPVRNLSKSMECLYNIKQDTSKDPNFEVEHGGR